MSKGKNDKVKYKLYEQGQQFLLPPGLEELVPAGHLARLVSEVTVELNVEPMLRKKIPGGGAGRYHPEMFAKVFACGYMNRTCSCRLLAKALRENAVYMRMSGNQKPGFKTVNEFRRVVLKDVMEEIFVAAVKLLATKGYVKLENAVLKNRLCRRDEDRKREWALLVCVEEDYREERQETRRKTARVRKSVQ